MKRTAAILILTASGCAAACASGASSPAAAAAEEQLGLWHIAGQLWKNPAVNQWRMSAGITRVGAGYSNRSEKSGDCDPRFGSGDAFWSAGADTYTKYRSSTLWGSARYTNGKTEGMLWNETADYDIVYPYVLADSVGGDMKREVYAFAGGYADRRGRWAWGAEMSYRATLEYRDVDPRPKNVVGCLDIAVGGAFNLARDYYAGISFNFRKYKQDNDIDFKSEMGNDKIFHLTGMGTDYHRFAGTGHDTYYDGYRYGLTADFAPASGSGAFASVDISRFTFDNILSEYNKLPMASAWHNSIGVRAGWLNRPAHSYWGVAMSVTAYRRHGTENIFGDPAGGIYPQVGANAMYADNGTQASLDGMWGTIWGAAGRVAVSGGAGWQRRITSYMDPWRQSETKAVTAHAGAGAYVPLSGGWLLSADAGISYRRPYGCRYVHTPGGNTETAALQAIERQAFDRAAQTRTQARAGVAVARTFGKYLGRIAGDIDYRTYSVSISLIF